MEGDNPSKEAWALLDAALTLMTKKGLNAYTVKKTKSGKPYFEQGYPNFNISHSGQYVCCALSDIPVGIDVETVRPISSFVMKRFLKSEETMPEKQIRLWTRYESLGKCLGCGIPHNIDGSGYCFEEKTYKDVCFTVCLTKKDSDFMFIEL